MNYKKKKKSLNVRSPGLIIGIVYRISNFILSSAAEIFIISTML